MGKYIFLIMWITYYKYQKATYVVWGKQIFLDDLWLMCSWYGAFQHHEHLQNKQFSISSQLHFQCMLMNMIVPFITWIIPLIEVFKSVLMVGDVMNICQLKWASELSLDGSIIIF